jgi:hypothetical protein
MCGGKETRDNGGQPNAGEEKQEMKEDSTLKRQEM